MMEIKKARIIKILLITEEDSQKIIELLKENVKFKFIGLNEKNLYELGEYNEEYGKL